MVLLKFNKKSVFFIIFFLMVLFYFVYQFFRLDDEVCEVVRSKPEECYIDLTWYDDKLNGKTLYICTNYDYGFFPRKAVAMIYDENNTLIYLEKASRLKYSPEMRTLYTVTDEGGKINFISGDDTSLSVNPSLLRKIDAKMVQNYCGKVR